MRTIPAIVLSSCIFFSINTDFFLMSGDTEDFLFVTGEMASHLFIPGEESHLQVG